MKKRLLGRLIALGTVSAIAVSALSIAATYAAYLNHRKAEVSGSVNADFSAYFAGGNGEQSTPYLIATADQIVALERLTKLGVFDSSTHFMLNADIDFGDKILTPIGTENAPFLSRFDGNGHHLKNVRISSEGGEDVGFFGYVGSGGDIRNIIFDSVEVTSEGATTPAVENPLAARFDNGDGTTLLNPKLAANSSLAPTISGQRLVLPTAQKVTDKGGHSYDVDYRYNDPTIFDADGTLLNAVTGLEASIFYTTVDATIRESYYDSKTGGLRFATYVIQRYEVYIRRESNGTQTFSTSADYPTIPTATMFYEGADLNLNRHYYTETGTNAHITEPRHLVYVGLCIGHLDGKASNIGVYQSKLTARIKEQVSFSTLIGKRTTDTNLLDSRNANYFEDMDYNEFLKNNTVTSEGYPATTNSSKTRYNDPITDFDAPLDASGKPIGEGIQFPDAFKMFGYMKPVEKSGLTSYEYDEEGNIIDTLKDQTYRGLLLNKDLTYKILGSSPFLGISRYYGMEVNNGFWFWASLSIDSINWFMNILTQLFGKNPSFQIKLQVVYSVDDCITATENGTSFQMQLSKMSVDKTPLGGGLITADGSGTWTDKSDSGKPSTVCTNSEQSNIIQTYEFSDIAQSDTSWIGGSDTNKQFTPMYAFGLKNATGAAGTSNVNIYGIKFTLTSANGNSTNNLANIDFIYGIDSGIVNYTPSPGAWGAGSWTKWVSQSNADINFLLAEYPASETNTGISAADVQSGLVYTVSRSKDGIFGPNVTVNYKELGTENVNLAPNDKSSVARISRDTALT